MDDVPEWKLRAGAIPAALVLALVFHGCNTGHFVQRTALTMPLHELGHAVTAWLCGFAAIPTLWKTLIPESRGLLAPLVVGAGAGVLVWRAWLAERKDVVAIGVAIAGLLVIGTLLTSVSRAQMLITFGGDAGAMILGSLLMLTMFCGPDSRLRVGGLRYGLVAIGAAAIVDTFAMWWSARTDPDVIPFGEIEGVGLSDPSKLDEVYGWTTHAIVQRYVTVGVICLVVVLAVWLRATISARRAA